MRFFGRVFLDELEGVGIATVFVYDWHENLIQCAV